MVKILVFVYVLAASGGYLILNSMMFHPKPEEFSAELKTQLISIESEVGPISALHLKAENATKTVIYCHGNAEDINNRFWTFPLFTKNHFSVLAFDYPGYGFTPGKPTEASVYASADAAYRYLTETCGIKPEDIVIYGRSIGSGPAHYLAEKYHVGHLIIECGFTSAPRVVTHIRLMPFDAFPNVSRIRNIHCPVLYLHGEEDHVVPFSHGQKMFAKANEPKYKRWLSNCDHNDIIQTMGEDNYAKTIADFINDTLKK